MQSDPKAILCLCYDTHVLEIRRMLLEHFGYRVFPTHTAEDAKHLAENKCPDMLLMDNSDPAVDYERLAQEVKNICPDVITVVLSPYYRVYRNGSMGPIDRFVVKDDGPDALLEQIEELFGGTRQRTLRPM
jgi:DNA-binding NarL/FixJ family response regulator